MLPDKQTKLSYNYQNCGKRLLDLAVATFSILCIAPVLLLIGIAVRIVLGSPVLFLHQRPGLHARPFYLLKFRTMTDARDADGNLLPDEDRITAFGNFLRRMSLDELPELINVIKGDMSIVGPRPLLMQYLGRYSIEQIRRHDVLPGITGWAQVNGRNALSWEEKFAHDVWYVNHISLLLDLKILWMTLRKVVSKEGISQPGYVSAEEFMGSK